MQEQIINSGTGIATCGHSVGTVKYSGPFGRRLAIILLIQRYDATLSCWNSARWTRRCERACTGCSSASAASSTAATSTYHRPGWHVAARHAGAGNRLQA